MEYAVYFEADGIVCRLPVNPEEISFSRQMDTEQYRMLTGRQIVVPVGRNLEEISFETEFPHDERSYTNKGFRNGDVWEKKLKNWQENKTVVRVIISNGVSQDISREVLLTQVDTVEKAGEEGDKYLSLQMMEYIVPTKKYVSVQKIKNDKSTAANPAVTQGKEHTVVKGDTLWGIAKKYYGNGSLYSKILQENPGKIKNPNLIYPGQVFSIPA